jgi:hypothetical protein
MSSVFLRPRNPVLGAPKILEFPYTPQIEYSNDVKYDAFNLTHTNYQPYAYAKTENPQISLTCKFSAHSRDHFNISVNAIRFLRTYTKMNYGRDDKDRGQTPRILRFFALGSNFYNVPVVISKFNMTFPEDVDYIKGKIDLGSEKQTGNTVENVGSRKIPTNAGAGRGSYGMPQVTPEPGVDVVNQAGMVVNTTEQFAYLPSVFSISIGLLVQQNIAKTVTEFTLEKFARGEMTELGYI